MTEYKMTVTRMDVNPVYLDQMAEFKRRQQERHYGSSEFLEAPTETVTVRALEVMLTDVEFEVVKRAVLETFK